MSDPIEELKITTQWLISEYEAWKSEALSLRPFKNDAHHLRSILAHLAHPGIHTDKVDAQITMGLEDQQKNLIEVLDREIQG